jgi:hypothetical protein
MLLWTLGRLQVLSPNRFEPVKSPLSVQPAETTPLVHTVLYAHGAAAPDA